MRDVAIISFAQTKHERSVDDRNEVEMLMPVVREALGDGRHDHRPTSASPARAAPTTWPARPSAS